MRYCTSNMATNGEDSGSATATSKILRPITFRTYSSFDCTIDGSWHGSPTITVLRRPRQAA